MDKCNLCLLQKPLCKKSHIIPDFMYQELFDERHRMVKGNIGTGERPLNIQSGEYEGGILCPDCDNGIIGGYEGYASKVLYGGNVPVSMENVRKADDGLELTILHGLDYSKFKLFLLSILWRASISSLPFFSSVNLGPYEEKIRLMLLSGDPGPASCFPCVINSYKRTSIPTGMIPPPTKFRLWDGKIMYSFIVAGMMYVFRININENLDWVLDVAVSEKGEMKIPHIPQESASKLFNKLIGEKVF